MGVGKNKVDGIFLIILSKEYVGFVGLDFRMAIIEAYSTARKCGLASQSINTWTLSGSEENTRQMTWMNCGTVCVTYRSHRLVMLNKLPNTFGSPLMIESC